MINSEPDTGENDDFVPPDATVSAILQSGAAGAGVLAGLTTAIVVAIWLAFYLLVFMPRAMSP